MRARTPGVDLGHDGLSIHEEDGALAAYGVLLGSDARAFLHRRTRADRGAIRIGRSPRSSNADALRRYRRLGFRGGRLTEKWAWTPQRGLPRTAIC